VRFDTIVGTFGAASWGGNRDDAGWRMLGFTHEPAFRPPFGYYDADAGKGIDMPAHQAARFPPSQTVDFAIVGSGAAGGIAKGCPRPAFQSSSSSRSRGGRGAVRPR
jgi:hypothetical protein